MATVEKNVAENIATHSFIHLSDSHTHANMTMWREACTSILTHHGASGVAGNSLPHTDGFGVVRVHRLSVVIKAVISETQRHTDGGHKWKSSGDGQEDVKCEDGGINSKRKETASPSCETKSQFPNFEALVCP